MTQNLKKKTILYFVQFETRRYYYETLYYYNRVYTQLINVSKLSLCIIIGLFQIAIIRWCVLEVY